MKKCNVGAVAYFLPAFPGNWALPERMLFSQTWEAILHPQLPLLAE